MNVVDDLWRTVVLVEMQQVCHNKSDVRRGVSDHEEVNSAAGVS